MAKNIPWRGGHRYHSQEVLGAGGLPHAKVGCSGPWKAKGGGMICLSCYVEIAVATLQHLDVADAEWRAARLRGSNNGQARVK